MLIVNLKGYRSAVGTKAEKIAEAASKAASNTGEKIVIAPQPSDLFRIQKKDIEAYSQHTDPQKPGSHTGSILPEAVEPLVSGTLLNHSEKRIIPDKIEKTVKRCQKLDLTTVVCAQTPEECGELSNYGPDYIAFEPPELIGGDVSVSESKPELIQDAVEKSSVPVLTGAGIKKREDVEKSRELGTKGVLVASGVVKSETPREEMEELCRGL